MSRYIDADALIDKLGRSFINMDDCRFESPAEVNGMLDFAIDCVKEQPTADMVDNKVLKLLLDWAIECGFGYDSIPEEYEKYKDDIQDMSYADGLIYIAMKEVEDEQLH